MYKTVSNLMISEVKRMGFSDAKSCAKEIGVNYELFRKVLAGGHVPRDEQLLVYAEKLNLDKKELIRVGHYERAPEPAKIYLEDLIHPPVKLDTIGEGEKKYVEQLLQILRSDKPQVVEGIKASLQAFFNMAQASKKE